MKTFNCDSCGHPVFFENTHCLNCTHPLGYIADKQKMIAITAGEVEGLWTSAGSHSCTELYRKCENYSERNVCNWMVAEGAPESLCQACRLNRTIPNLSDPQNILCWKRLEAAKHRLVYSLLHLGLPLKNKQEDPANGLAFDFLASADPDFGNTQPVITGHDQGVITINIAEADPVIRLKMRLDMNERYRTILGHFRHEVGHYYWQLLIHDGSQLDAFRNLFGDEQQDYETALQHYYSQGASADWQDFHISSYASSHPWEDWAETWAHYLHMVDTLETSRMFGLNDIDFPVQALPLSSEQFETSHPANKSFEVLLNEWLPLTLALNSINRSMGMDDMYPFVLSKAVVEKLLFIHQIINQARC